MDCRHPTWFAGSARNRPYHVWIQQRRPLESANLDTSDLHAFIGTILDLREYADHQPRGIYITPVFDRCQEFVGQALSDYRDRNKDGKLGQMQVSDSRTHIQLQVADFIAWEYRVNAEVYIRTGNREPGSALRLLLQHGFRAKAWRFEDLEYLRQRVEAVQAGVDPDMIAAPSRS